MSSSDLQVDNEGNKLIGDDHVTKSRVKRDKFHKQIVESLDEMTLSGKDEILILDYMRNKQGSPETLDEICRQAHVEMEYVIWWLELMVSENVVERQVTSGVSRYALTDTARTADWKPGNSVVSRYKDQSAAESKTNDLNGNEKPEDIDETYVEDSNASAEELEQHLEEGCWVLINGCDSGEFIAGLAKKFPHTSFIALHNNGKILVNMMETCIQAKVYNVNFQEGEPDLLPNSWVQCFDWAILYDVIHDVPDVRASLQNVRRVLKSSGVLSLTFKPGKSSMKDDDFRNDNATSEARVDETSDSTSGVTPMESTGKKGVLTAEYVRKMVAETMFDIIRSDAMNSNEERIHIMCAVSDGI